MAVGAFCLASTQSFGTGNAPYPTCSQQTQPDGSLYGHVATERTSAAAMERDCLEETDEDESGHAPVNRPARITYRLNETTKKVLRGHGSPDATTLNLQRNLILRI